MPSRQRSRLHPAAELQRLAKTRHVRGRNHVGSRAGRGGSCSGGSTVAVLVGSELVDWVSSQSLRTCKRVQLLLVGQPDPTQRLNKNMLASCSEIWKSR